MPEYTVYAPTDLAIRNSVFHPEERIIFLGDGSAAVYRDGILTQSDLPYRNPNAHVFATEERLPTELKATAREKASVKENNIQLPFSLV